MGRSLTFKLGTATAASTSSGNRRSTRSCFNASRSGIGCARASGQLYGADGAFKLGKDGSGTAAFRVDEPAGTVDIQHEAEVRRLQHAQRRLAAHAAEGQVYGADGAFKLGKDGNGTAAFRVDEPAGTSTFNTKLKFDDPTSTSTRLAAHA